MDFPTELGVLTCLMVLAASLWIPFIVRSGSDAGVVDGFDRPHDVTKLKPRVHRAHRAHLKLLEQAFPFAVLVLIIARMDGSTSLTYWTAIGFFWLRVLHAVGIIWGIAKMPLRQILFVLGWVCTLIMAYAAFAAI
jgi:uncharacterized MAPEG superfamily protein